MPDTTTHKTIVEISEPLPETVDAGTDVAMRVKVSCPTGCDLRGRPVTVMAGEIILAGADLATYHEKVNETERFTFKAPAEAGEHTLSVLVARHEDGTTVHEAGSISTALRTVPHPTSMAVWDAPAPAVLNTAFTVKVGVKCSAMCTLSGHVVEVHDENGATVGQAALRQETWPGSDALYWTEIPLPGPLVEQVQGWTVVFPTAGVALPHDAAAATFTFRSAKPPEHHVTVHVVACGSGTSLEDVEVRIGQYQVFTNADGLATIAVPKGTYNLTIRQDGYKAPPMSVAVNEDLTVTLEALTAITRAEIDERMRMFEGYPRFDY